VAAHLSGVPVRTGAHQFRVRHWVSRSPPGFPLLQYNWSFLVFCQYSFKGGVQAALYANCKLRIMNDLVRVAKCELDPAAAPGMICQVACVQHLLLFQWLDFAIGQMRGLHPERAYCPFPSSPSISRASENSRRSMMVGTSHTKLKDFWRSSNTRRFHLCSSSALASLA
jgi:hypothetical protein